MAFVQIGNLVRRILGRGIQHRNRNHGGKSASDAAGEEEIESDLVSSRFVHIGGRVPWVNRRRPGHGLIAAGEMCDVVIELAICRERPGVEFIDRVAHTVSLVGGTVGVAGVRRLRHPDAEVSHGDHPGNQLQRDGAALAFGDRAQAEKFARCPWWCRHRKVPVHRSRTGLSNAWHRARPRQFVWR